MPLSPRAGVCLTTHEEEAGGGVIGHGDAQGSTTRSGAVLVGSSSRASRPIGDDPSAWRRPSDRAPVAVRRAAAGILSVRWTTAGDASSAEGALMADDGPAGSNVLRTASGW